MPVRVRACAGSLKWCSDSLRRISSDGQVAVPLGLLAEAGVDSGTSIVVYSDGAGRIVLRRADDALEELLSSGSLS